MLLPGLLKTLTNIELVLLKRAITNELQSRHEEALDAMEDEVEFIEIADDNGESEDCSKCGKKCAAS